MTNRIVSGITFMDIAGALPPVTYSIDSTGPLVEDSITACVNGLIPTPLKPIFRQALAKLFGGTDDELVLMRGFNDKKPAIFLL